jgi:murein DD-endopeptidase MepM/ murein hydrolase activator NlpD
MANYVFNPITLQYEVREEPRYTKYIRTGLSIIVAGGLCFLYFWLYTSVLGWDLPKTARLKKENAVWQSKIALAERQLDICEETLQGIEERDDHVYRSIFGLNEIPAEAKAAGFGGDARYEYLDAMGATFNLKNTMRRLDQLTKRAYLQSTSLDEVYGISLTAGDMVSHIPAVPPLLPDKSRIHMASPFGYRSDPIYGGTRLHEGQDMATFSGNPVYATGDGIVVKTDFKFTGYGNEIVIDHGFGYKTRFAHLSRIDVAPGMQLHRGDLIGAVGATGKATGPHLHYEVIYMGSPVNPYGFMDMDMPLDEYRAMIDKRSEENSPRQKTSLELLRERTGK